MVDDRNNPRAEDVGLCDHKKCSKCEEWKLKSEFNRRSQAPDGYASCCRQCGKKAFYKYKPRKGKDKGKKEPHCHYKGYIPPVGSVFHARTRVKGRSHHSDPFKCLAVTSDHIEGQSLTHDVVCDLAFHDFILRPKNKKV